MADDDDLIYVDVVPRLDEGEAEKATGRLRDKFKEGAKGVGKAVSDVLHSELADEIGRTIGPVAHDMGVQLGKELGSKAGDFLHEQISGALKEIGVDFDGVIDKAKDLADQFGVDEKSVGKLTDAFKDFKSGDTAKGINDLVSALEKVPGPVGDAAQKSKGLLDTFSQLKGDIKETTNGFLGLTNNSGKIASGLSAIEAAAGPLAATFAALDSLMPGFDQHLNNVIAQMQGKQAFNPKDWFNTLVPGTNLFDKALGGPAGGADPTKGFQSPVPAKPGVPLIPTPGSAPAAPPGYTASPGSLDPFSALMPSGTAPPSAGVPSIAPPDVGGGAHTSGFSSGGGVHATLADFTTPSLPNVTSPQDLTAAGGGVANLYRVAESLQGTPYSQKIRNDCSGMVSQLASAALGLPAPGPGERFSTVNEGQWLASHGFQMGTPPPGMANSSLQIGWYDHGGGNLGHTAATLPGGVNAESGGSVGSFSLGGPVGANSPQFEHHAYLPMGMGMPGAPMAGGPGGPRVSPAGFGIGPGTPGIPGLPGLVAPPTMPNMGGGGSPGPVAQQPIGHGSGVGVTGGGALGMAEQAGVMAAAMFGFGGGGMAAQIGMQEMNLAIQKGGQMAATAAMAIPETFMLSGGQMGAPSVGQGGWIRKILGGLMGQQFNAPNIAGGSQPAKQPKQKEGEGEGEQDPLKGGKGGPKGGKPGPSGHADDPIHVQQVNPPDAQPQGQATSAMNAAGVMSAVTA